MERDGRTSAPNFAVMMKKTKYLTQGALIAALYVALCLLQDALFYASASQMIQFRAAEALCVLAFFTPAAVWGLTVGCFLFNLSFAGTLPLDLVLGTLASLLAAGGMYLCRNVKIKSLPLLGLLLPAVFNGLLVGLSLTVNVGMAYWLNALCVAVGELGVMLTLGIGLYYLLSSRKLQNRLF